MCTKYKNYCPKSLASYRLKTITEINAQHQSLRVVETPVKANIKIVRIILASCGRKFSFKG